MTQVTVIVGAGQAGAHAAFAMRSIGYTGEIFLIGAEVERPYERPPLSKQMLTALDEPPITYFHALRRYEEQAIVLMCGKTVTSIDPLGHSVRLSDGCDLAYTSLLVVSQGVV